VEATNTFSLYDLIFPASQELDKLAVGGPDAYISQTRHFNRGFHYLNRRTISAKGFFCHFLHNIDGKWDLQDGLNLNSMFRAESGSKFDQKMMFHEKIVKMRILKT